MSSTDRVKRGRGRPRGSSQRGGRGDGNLLRPHPAEFAHSAAMGAPWSAYVPPYNPYMPMYAPAPMQPPAMMGMPSVGAASLPADHGKGGGKAGAQKGQGKGGGRKRKEKVVPDRPPQPEPSHSNSYDAIPLDGCGEDVDENDEADVAVTEEVGKGLLSEAEERILIRIRCQHEAAINQDKNNPNNNVWKHITEIFHTHPEVKKTLEVRQLKNRWDYLWLLYSKWCRRRDYLQCQVTGSDGTELDNHVATPPLFKEEFDAYNMFEMPSIRTPFHLNAEKADGLLSDGDAGGASEDSKSNSEEEDGDESGEDDCEEDDDKDVEGSASETVAEGGGGNGNGRSGSDHRGAQNIWGGNNHGSQSVNHHWAPTYVYGHGQSSVGTQHWPGSFHPSPPPPPADTGCVPAVRVTSQTRGTAGLQGLGPQVHADGSGAPVQPPTPAELGSAKGVEVRLPMPPARKRTKTSAYNHGQCDEGGNGGDAEGSGKKHRKPGPRSKNEQFTEVMTELRSTRQMFVQQLKGGGGGALTSPPASATKTASEPGSGASDNGGRERGQVRDAGSAADGDGGVAQGAASDPAGDPSENLFDKLFARMDQRRDAQRREELSDPMREKEERALTAFEQMAAAMTAKMQAEAAALQGRAAAAPPDGTALSGP